MWVLIRGCVGVAERASNNERGSAESSDKMKAGKTPGLDGIQMECLKADTVHDGVAEFL